MGSECLAWIEALPGYEGLIVLADGTREVTSGWGDLVSGR